MTTSRDQVDLTSVGDEFKSQYEAGLISGQGTMNCIWEHSYETGDRANEYGADSEFDLVFHGGSGSLLSEIRETLDYGVVKMNVDTDTQYSFTRPIAGHMLENYEGVLKVDGEIGNKKVYDPRAYLKAGEQSMSERVGKACDDLLSVDKTIISQV